MVVKGTPYVLQRKSLNKLNFHFFFFFQIDHDESKKHPIELRNASFSWHDSPNQQLQDSTLRNVTWHVPQGSLVAIVGIVGSGKSSLLSSLLGDMIRVSGDANIKG